MRGTTLNVLAMVLAGGEGKRLRPLTEERAKPAVPFGGLYRIVDFVITNLYRSGVYKIGLLTQHKPRSLDRHVERGYIPVFGSRGHSYFKPLHPTGVPYEGTADAVYKNLEMVKQENFDIIDVFGADHIYRMNVAQMHDFHLEKDADATISVMPASIDVARGELGVVVIGEDGIIIKFEEKPNNPTPMPGDSTKCLISMGNYSFRPKSLEEVLRDNPTDFGKDVFPQMINQGKRIFAYDFSQNTIEGFRPEDVVYWRDVGSIGQFYDAHMDLVGENPALRLQHQKWKMLTHIELPETSRVTGRAAVSDYIVAPGVWIHDDATVRGSVISYGVEVLQDAYVVNSILMGYTVVGKGSVIKNTIIDRRGNEDDGINERLVFPSNTMIGINPEDDARRGLKVIEIGRARTITVVPRMHEFA